jgi:hypothetical protein
MRKMGNFKGLPVFMVNDPFEWANMRNEGLYEEKIYVYRTNVYYKWNKIAAISGDTLLGFDEDLFNELRRKSWDDDRAQMLAHVTGSAETRPQDEEKSVKETVEAPDRIVDNFMETWRDNIDNEIAVLKSSVAQMEDMLNAVG